MQTVLMATEDIVADDLFQMRAEMSQEAVEEYAQAMRDGAVFDPLDVFNTGGSLFVVDGFHRLAAAKLARMDEVRVRLHQGSRRDALIFALKANTGPRALRRTNADKRKAVMRALDDQEFRAMSDRAIAEICGVGRDMVGYLRSQLSESDSSTRRVGMDGKERKSTRAKPAPVVSLVVAPPVSVPDESSEEEDEYEREFLERFPEPDPDREPTVYEIAEKERVIPMLLGSLRGLSHGRLLMPGGGVIRAEIQSLIAALVKGKHDPRAFAGRLHKLSRDLGSVASALESELNNQRRPGGVTASTRRK